MMMMNDDLIMIGPPIVFTSLIEAYNFAYRSARLSYRYHRTLASLYWTQMEQTFDMSVATRFNQLYRECVAIYTLFGEAILSHNLTFVGV